MVSESAASGSFSNAISNMSNMSLFCRLVILQFSSSGGFLAQKTCDFLRHCFKLVYHQVACLCTWRAQHTLPYNTFVLFCCHYSRKLRLAITISVLHHINSCKVKPQYDLESVSIHKTKITYCQRCVLCLKYSHKNYMLSLIHTITSYFLC